MVLSLWPSRPCVQNTKGTNGTKGIERSSVLMTQFVSELGDHGVHLVFEMKFLFLELDFFQVVVLRHVVAIL